MYVGKIITRMTSLHSSLQQGNDWWFHAKGMPGSHVIVKSENKELPDSTFEEAGRLAGYYSKGKGDDKLEIDYLQKKMSKPNGSAPDLLSTTPTTLLPSHPTLMGIKEADD